MGQEDVFAELVDVSYQAASGEVSWSDALYRFTETFAAAGGSLITHDFATGQGARTHAVGLDLCFRPHLPRHGAAKSPWLRGREIFQPGRVHTDREIVADRSPAGTNFYSDYLDPRKCAHRLCRVVGRHGHKVSYLTMHRGHRARAFDDADRAFLQRLAPHVERALTLQRRVVHGYAEHDALAGVLDILPFAALLVDCEARPITLNGPAERLLARNDGLALTNGRVAAAARLQHDRLIRLIANAANTSGREREASGSTAIARPSGRLPLVLMVSPLHRSVLPNADPGCGIAAILVKDPEANSKVSADELSAVYGLTPAEARVAALIVNGFCLIDVTHKLGISKNTARSHMKRIYAKTGVQRAAELVRLVANSGPLRR